MKEAFAEVIQSSLNVFQAQSWQWNIYPEFGQLVKIINKQKIIFAIVYNIEINFQNNQIINNIYKKTEIELKRDHPEIFEFLISTFNCIIVGYLENNKLFYQPSLEPANIHNFVYHTTMDDLNIFFKNNDYLHILFNANNLYCLDDLILAIIKNLVNKKMLTSDFLKKFLENFYFLISSDYRRFKIFIKRIKNIIEF